MNELLFSCFKVGLILGYNLQELVHIIMISEWLNPEWQYFWLPLLLYWSLIKSFSRPSTWQSIAQGVMTEMIIVKTTNTHVNQNSIYTLGPINGFLFSIRISISTYLYTQLKITIYQFCTTAKQCELVKIILKSQIVFYNGLKSSSLLSTSH